MRVKLQCVICTEDGQEATVPDIIILLQSGGRVPHVYRAQSPPDPE